MEGFYSLILIQFLSKGNQNLKLKYNKECQSLKN